MSRQFTALVAAAVMASHAFGAAVGASEEPSRPAADPAEPPVEEQDPAGKKTEPVKTREVQLDELTL
ncbi:MAG TPA: hypothetical protein VML55_11680, partial [Planctomycetaceae bacterium]|nr:hypothetical protein [Planctomycetaceae bacterium]